MFGNLNSDSTKMNAPRLGVSEVNHSCAPVLLRVMQNSIKHNQLQYVLLLDTLV